MFSVILQWQASAFVKQISIFPMWKQSSLLQKSPFYSNFNVMWILKDWLQRSYELTNSGITVLCYLSVGIDSKLLPITLILFEPKRPKWRFKIDFFIPIKTEPNSLVVEREYQVRLCRSWDNNWNRLLL